MMARYLRPLSALGLAALLALVAGAAMAKPIETPAHPVDPRYVWDLTDLYASPEAWAAEFAKIKEGVGRIERFKGTLGKSAHDMFVALDEMSRLQKEVARLYTYASLKADEDTSIAQNQERKQQAGALFTLFGEKTAWLSPEILAVGASRVHAFEAREKGLHDRFDFFLDNVLRAAPHTLGLEAEGVIASNGDLLQQPQNIYGQITYSDMPWPTVKLSTGESVKLDQAAYTKYRSSNVRADRKLVFDAFFKTYKAYEGTLGSTLTAQVMGDEFTAKVRHFPNALASALFNDNMPEAVYRTLVAQANAGLPVLHRYLNLRKRLLGIRGDLEYYDGYPDDVPEQPSAAFRCGAIGTHRARRASALWRNVSGLSAQGFRFALDARLSAAAQGLGRVHERLGLRRAPVSSVEPHRRLSGPVDAGARMGPRGAHHADPRRAAV